MRAASDRRELGVSGEEAHLRHAYAQPLGDELREAGLVALAGRQRPEHDIDSALRTYEDFGALARCAGVELHVVAQADAAQPAALARGRAARLEPRPVGKRDYAGLYAAIVAAVVIVLTVARGSYIAYVRFPERSFAQVDLPDNDWKRTMAWARATDRDSHWLADPFHAARYGSSLRVAGHRDVFVEEIKDSAVGMYDRPVAIRTRDRLAALGSFDSLTAADALDLASRFDLDYLIADRPFDLPVAFRAGELTIYRLR